jgi:hypothetical protein
LSRTAVQTIRCMILGRFRACVSEGELYVWGPELLPENIRTSVKENCADIVEILEEYCDGAWPPPPGSPIHGYEDDALDLIEQHWRAA